VDANFAIGPFVWQIEVDLYINEFNVEANFGIGLSQGLALITKMHVLERAIQTIMYMARTFMVHASLHWTDRGSDDLSLWSFAVKHSVWIYNRVPNAWSGLTPLELVTKERSDSKDILRCHVWGCPVYVLEAKLQNDQKLPKWNMRARLGQFVEFSDEHSSLVANVRHLTTGYISPQFHVVFDDLFETVNCIGVDDCVIESICNGLVKRNCELYAEDELDEAGNIIY
jgi:hypothetical protein